MSRVGVEYRSRADGLTDGHGSRAGEWWTRRRLIVRWAGAFSLLIAAACTMSDVRPRPTYVEGVPSWVSPRSFSISDGEQTLDCATEAPGLEELGIEVGAFRVSDKCVFAHPVTARWDAYLKSASSDIQFGIPAGETNHYLSFTTPLNRDGEHIATPGDSGWQFAMFNETSSYADFNTTVDFIGVGGANPEATEATIDVLLGMNAAGNRIRDVFARIVENGGGTPEDAFELYLGLLDMHTEIEAGRERTVLDGYSDFMDTVDAATARQLNGQVFRLAAYHGGMRRQPAFYRGVAANSTGVAAVRAGPTWRGSAFMIANAWMLTCDHVVAEHIADDLQVVFHHEEPRRPAAENSLSCAVEDVMPSNDRSMDLALLRVSCPASSDTPTPLTLADRFPPLHEFLYVIGHPGGSYKAIADNAQVRYPHRVSPRLRGDIRSGLGAGWFEDFDASYRQGDDGHYYYRVPGSKFDYLPDEVAIPDFGFDSDTEPGFSGGAVISSLDHQVVGLFFGSARDFRQRDDFAWDRHEHAIPAPRIREWLAAQGFAMEALAGERE